MPSSTTTIDVRAVPPRERHPLIFANYRALPPGSAIELVNDHDPRPLQRQFEAESPGGFEWDELESGPVTWRVQITKLGTREPCCGVCGCA